MMDRNWALKFFFFGWFLQYISDLWTPHCARNYYGNRKNPKEFACGRWASSRISIKKKKQRCETWCALFASSLSSTNLGFNETQNFTTSKTYAYSFVHPEISPQYVHIFEIKKVWRTSWYHDQQNNLKGCGHNHTTDTSPSQFHYLWCKSLYCALPSYTSGFSGKLPIGKRRWHPQLHDMHRHIMCSRCHMSVNLGVRNGTELLKWIMTKVATEASNSCGTQWLLYHIATIKMWNNNVVKLYSNYSWWFEAVWNILDCQLASFLQVGAKITTLWRYSFTDQAAKYKAKKIGMDPCQ